MICYQLKNQTFFNPYTAFLYASQNDPHGHVEFNVHDESFSKADWSIYPKMSYKDLFKIRAEKLRNRYDKIIIAYSGGSDSQTVLKSFLDNNIHVDEIFLSLVKEKEYVDATGVDNRALDYVKQTWKEQTKHTHFKLMYINDFIMNRFTNSEWVLDQERTFHNRFSVGVLPWDVIEYYREKYSNQHWCIITGHEKPTVTDDCKHAYFFDKAFVHVMNRPNTEFFFIDPEMPEISIKQAHDLVRAKKIGITDYYQEKAMIGCGYNLPFVKSSTEKQILKHTDRVLGQMTLCDLTSSIEKLEKYIEVEQGNNGYLKTIRHWLRTNPDLAHNWASGYASIQSDQTIINYMVNHGYLDHLLHSVQSYNGIKSRHYCLTNS